MNYSYLKIIKSSTHRHTQTHTHTSTHIQTPAKNHMSRRFRPFQVFFFPENIFLSEEAKRDFGSFQVLGVHFSPFRKKIFFFRYLLKTINEFTTYLYRCGLSSGSKDLSQHNCLCLVLSLFDLLRRLLMLLRLDRSDSSSSGFTRRECPIAACQ